MTKAVIDSGSLVTCISEIFFKCLNPMSASHDMSERFPLIFEINADVLKPKAAIDTQFHFTVLTPPLYACFLETLISSTHHALLSVPIWIDGRKMPLGEPR